MREGQGDSPQRIFPTFYRPLSLSFNGLGKYLLYLIHFATLRLGHASVDATIRPGDILRLEDEELGIAKMKGVN